MPLKGTKALEAWCQRVTSEYPNVEITNMTSSWRNGLGFCAIIHHHCPHLINFSSLDPEDVFENNQLAFQMAEEHLGIPSLLEPQDMVSCQVLDKLSIITYLAQYYKALHNPAALQLRVRTSPPAICRARDTAKMVEEADTSITGVAKDIVDVHNNTLVKQTMANVATTHDNQPLSNTAPVNQHSTNCIQDNQTMLNTSTATQPRNGASFTTHDIQPLSSTSTTPVNQPPNYHTPDKQTIKCTSTCPPVKQPLTIHLPDKQPMLSTSTTPPGKQPLTSHIPDNQPMISTSPPVKQPLTSQTPDKQPMISTSTTPPFKQPLTSHIPDNQPITSTSPPVKQHLTCHTPDKQPMLSTSTTPPVKQPKTNQTPEKQPMISTSTTPPVKQPKTHHTPYMQPMISTIITSPVKQPLNSHTPEKQPPVIITSTTANVIHPLTNHTPDKQPTIITTSDQLASSSQSPPTKAATPLASLADKQPGEVCLVCGLAVYILERCSAGGGHPLHRACARCGKCGLPGVGRGSRVERGQVVCGLCQGVEGGTSGEKKGNACNEDCQKQNVTDAAAKHTSSSKEIRKWPPPPKPARTFLIKQEPVVILGSPSLAPSARSNMHSSSNTSDPSSPGDKKESVVLPSKETEAIVKANREALPNFQNRLEQCNQELFDLDIKLAGLEKQGVNMEKKIRKSLEFQETNDEFECVFDPREDDLILQLFDLVNEKNELVRKQSEVMFIKKERMLDIEQVECEEQVRVLLDKSPWLKTESDKLEEELLINNIIEIVKRRNEIVNHLEMDRIRETEEDSAFSDVKLKLTNSEDLQNIKKPRKASARKRLMSWISRKN